MPRHESDKEDLIADAVALVDRAEYSLIDEVAQETKIVTVGFRSDCSMSIYFNQDPFYQFDSDGLLRRAFADGFLYRSQGTTLAKLQRERTEGRVTLVRTDLTQSELQEFHQRMESLLHEFRNAVHTGKALQLRSVTDLQNFDTLLTQQIDKVLTHEVEFFSSSINRRK